MKTRILIAEDDAMPRKALARALESWGYDVVSAADGEAGWQLYQEQPINLVVSDWEMPSSSGIDFCRRVRASKDRDYTYFVLLTSRSDKGSLVEALEAGADDFVAKPFDEGELHARIRAGERILRLSHELARRLDQLVSANQSNRQLNLQLARDMQGLVTSINNWVSRESPAGDADLVKKIRHDLKQELTGVIEEWMASLGSPEDVK